MVRHRNKILPKWVSSSSTYTLSKEQLQFYEENGYLVVKKLFDLPTLNAFKKRFDDFCNGKLNSQQYIVIKDKSLCRPGAKPEEYIYKIQDLLYDDVFSMYLEDPRLLEVVAQMIGENITALNCMLINKPPGTAEHGAHQDLLYMMWRPVNKIIGVWTAIDAANKDNGCLYMVPGSHKPEELFEHVPVAGKKLFYDIAEPDKVAPEDKRVYLEMEPGDTVLFTPRTVHGSMPNTTKNYRKCMSCHYVNSDSYFIDVNGTRHEHFVKAVEAEIKRLSGDFNFNASINWLLSANDLGLVCVKNTRVTTPFIPQGAVKPAEIHCTQM